MIEIKNLMKHYPEGINPIIQQFNYHFAQGLYHLQGHNGVGKSTLLKILAGVDVDYEGSYLFKGKDNKKNRYLLNDHRSFIPDEPTFYPYLSAIEFIRMMCSLRKKSFKDQMTIWGVPFRVEDFAYTPLEKLSLGQRKKVFITANLFVDYDLWLLDEPANGLDLFSKNLLQEKFKKQSDEKKIVIFTSHDENWIRDLSGEKIIFPL